MSNASSRFIPTSFRILAFVACWLLLGAPVAGAQVSTPGAGEDGVYRDPEGRFTVPIPTNWIAEEHDGYLAVVTEDRLISVALVVIPGTSASGAIVQAMKIIDPKSDATPLPDLMATPTSGSDDVALYTYDDGSQSGQLVQAYGQRVNDVVFVLVLDGNIDAVGLRQIQVDKIRFGIEVHPDKLGSPVATPVS